MAGRELSSSGRDEEPVGSTGRSYPVLPATVAAAHLAACAESLAEGTEPARVGLSVPDLGELADVLTDLVTGQRQIAAALAHLATHLADRQRRGGLGTVVSPDLTALTEVLGAAACASGHAAGALSAGAPVLDAVLDAAGRDTRLS